MCKEEKFRKFPAAGNRIDRRQGGGMVGHSSGLHMRRCNVYVHRGFDTPQIPLPEARPPHMAKQPAEWVG